MYKEYRKMSESTVSKVEDVSTPCLLVNLDTVKSNIQKLKSTADQFKVNIRPSMSTHKTLEGGELMTGGAKCCITVSTLSEAEYFADGGYDDILLVTLLTAEKINRLKRVAERVKRFHVTVSNKFFIDLFKDNPLGAAGKAWSLYLNVDTGGKLAGVAWDSEEAVELAKYIHESNSLSLEGLYTDDTITYTAANSKEVPHLGNESAVKIRDLAYRLEEAKIPCPTRCGGSTPTSSLPGCRMGLLTEIHPGCAIFYDVQQSLLATCTVQEMAIRIATRVVAHYPDREQLVVDCGYSALSLGGKDEIPFGTTKQSYCLFDDHPNLCLVKMTQEMGIIESRRGPLRYDKYPLGSLLFLYPYRASATASMHSQYVVHQGDKVVAIWKPCRGW